MTPDSLLEDDWRAAVERLGGAAALTASAAETKAFVRPRRVASAVELLRLVLAYCLGQRSLRATSAWAAASGLVDISNSPPPRRRGLACCIGCASAATGWRCWSANCLRQRHRRRARAG